jgi:DUF971 family protein
MKKFTTFLLVFLAGFTGYAQTAELESNNTFNTANTIARDNVKTGSISPSSDQDFFVTRQQSDGTLKIYVKATNTGPSSSWLYLTVFGGNRGQLRTRYISGTTSVSPGATVYDTITLYGRAVDSVFFKFEASGTFSYEFKYDIKDMSTNDSEPNSSYASAILLPQGDTKSGHIKYAANGGTDDVDLYRTKTTIDGTLKIYVSATNRSGTNSWLYLTTFGGNKGQIVTRYISGTTSVVAGTTVNDTITIFGRGVDSLFFRLEASGAFSYNIKYEILETSTTDAEPNGLLSESVALNTKEIKRGHIKYASNGLTDDIDFYRTKTLDKGTLKIYVSATNRSGTNSWLYFSTLGGNKALLNGRYISGTTSVAAGATVYDTITIFGIGEDSVFFKVEASGAFSYNLSYDVKDINPGDPEPNGSFAAAAAMKPQEIKPGIIKYASNGGFDDADFYRTKTTEDGTLKVYVSGTNRSGANSWLQLTIYGGDKGQISQRYISGTTSIPVGATVFDTITVFGRGVDTVFFEIEASGAFSYNLSYDNTDINPGDPEPNGSFAEATVIKPQEKKSGIVKYAVNGTFDNLDFYRTKTPDDGTLKIYVSGTNRSGANSWLHLAVYGGNQGQISTRYISGTTSISAGATVFDTITIFGRAVDSVFFRLEASGAFSYSLSYQIIDTSAFDQEPNGSISEATAINQQEVKAGHAKYAANGTFDNLDYYRTKTPDDGTLQIYVSGINRSGANSWLHLTVYDGNKGQINTRYISGTTSVANGATIYDTITIRGRGADSVFFRFEASNAFSYTFRYEIQDKSINDTEPNNTFETALKAELKQTKSGHIMYTANGTTDQNDYYVTHIPVIGSLTLNIELTNTSGISSWVYLYVYNKSKGQVLAKYIKNSTSLPPGQLIRDTIVLNCLTTDTIYLRWTSSGSASYKFAMDIFDRHPYASMSHERLGNTIGFRPQLSNADKFQWDFGDGTSSTLKFPMKTYAKGYFIAKLIATNTVCNFKDTATTVFEIKGVEYYTPDSAGIGGDAILKIFGGGLDTNTKVTLKKGTIELNPVHLNTFKNNVQLNAVFDLHLAEQGTYDVIIEIKGQEPIVYPGGFKVNAFRYPYTYSEIVSPWRMRTNLNTNLKLVVGNTGNVMASGVLVTVIWPKSVDLKFVTKWFKPPASGDYTITAADTTFTFKWQDIQHFYSEAYQKSVTAIDTFNGRPYDGYMKLILIPKIAAGSTYEIPLIANTTTTGAKDFITYTFKPNLFGSCGSGSWMDVSENMAVESIDLLDKLVSVNPVLEKSPVGWLTKATKGTTIHMANLGQAMGAFYNYATGVTNSIDESLPADYYSNVDAGNAQVAKAVLDVAVDKMVEKGADGLFKGQSDQLNNFIAKNPNATSSTIDFAKSNLKDINDIRQFVKDAYKNTKDLNDLNDKLRRLDELLKDCPELKEQIDELKKNLNKDMTLRDPKKTTTASVNSFDPNAIIGPAGVGANQYVLKQDRQNFTITFENMSTATAAAQIVSIYDTLDAGKFDLGSFEFTNFTIANRTFNVPKGRQEFVLDDSLSPTMRVRINGRLNQSSGIVSWQYTAIDPSTGDLPVFEGFLPPNTIMPEGEGSVSYTLLPKQTLADGTVIKNRASIIFDQNEPILTNTWQNIVDALPPSSTVSATRVRGSREIHLTFSGSDASSGIGNYNIYIQEDGGEWLAIGSTPGESEIILADSTKRYHFYVMANDLLGNTEFKTPGAETTVGINELVKGKGELSMGPNPATELVYIGGLKQYGTFMVTDLLGKKLLSGNVSETNNRIDINHLKSGLYILYVFSKGEVHSFKLLKNIE